MSQSTPRIPYALPLSLAGHLAVLAAAVFVRFEHPVIDVRSPPVPFAWLTVPRLEPPPSLSQAERALPVEPRKQAPAAEGEEPATRAPARSLDSPRGGEAVAPTPVAPPRPDVDWVRQRAEAIAGLLDQRAREKRFATFTVDDAIPEPEPKRDPTPTGEIFSEHNTRSRAVLAPGQQRTRLARSIVDLCHALTGGFGVALQGFKAFSLCAAEGGRSDLFAAIKPGYLKKLPECIEGNDAAAAPGVTLTKCTLEAPEYLSGASSLEE